MPALAFLDSVNSIYTAGKAGWEREERRLFGSDYVVDTDLVKFDTEEASGTTFAGRKLQATYVNFMQLTASIYAGHLRRQAPTPGKGLSFGKLGEIRERDKVDIPTEAELAYYNVDGVGWDGSQWPAWLDSVEERACATGHRWVMVEASERAAATLQDKIDGMRPYLVEYSPLDVTNWSFTAGRLDFAICRIDTGSPSVAVDGTFKATEELGYYLLVRTGYEALGADFAKGGWWKYDKDKNLKAQGDWTLTKGQIPMGVFYAKRAKSSKLIKAMSRSMLMELGQIGVALMNQTSAQRFNAWAAAKTVYFMLGVDKESFELAAAKVLDGAVMIPVRGAQTSEGKEVTPTIQPSSAGAVETGVFETIRQGLFAEAREAAARQLMSTPDSSGASKNAGFLEGLSPELGLMAANREAIENSLIAWLEMRNGHAEPEGSVSWPREFDLRSVVNDIDESFESLARIPVVSPTLVTKLVMDMLREKGQLPDDPIQQKKIEAEIMADAESHVRTVQSGRARLKELEIEEDVAA